ncbi:MAG: ATP-dependent Clp protease proteolytic subunit [Polyangia bacterium]
MSKLRSRSWFLGVAVLGVLCATAQAAPGQEVDVSGTIDPALSSYLERVLNAATPEDHIVLRVNTFGGRVDAAVRIRDAMLRCKGQTLAFVEGRAISAGALISLAADRIYMSPAATMGAATPIQLRGGEMKPVEAKVVSYFRAEMKATAEAKHRRGDIAEAMVDPAVVIPELADTSEHTVTLTTSQALKTHMIDGQAATVADALAQAGWAQPTTTVSMSWAEKLARFLADDSISSLLMALGLLGVLIELWAPGHLMAGAFGATCLVLFFFGHWVVHLAGLGEVTLFALGFVAVLVEILLIPGHGVLLVCGSLAVMASLVLALVGRTTLPFDVSWALGSVTHALVMVSGALIASVAGLVIVARWLPQSRLGRALVLGDAIHASAAVDELLSVGEEGRTVTALRPAGTVIIGSRRIDVVSDGAFIEPDVAVRISSVDGARVVVVQTSVVKTSVVKT